MSLLVLFKSLSPSFLQTPFQYWKASIRSPQSLFLSRLINSNSFSLSSQERCVSPLLVFMAFFWTCSKRSKGQFSPAFYQNHVSTFWASTSKGKNWSKLKASGSLCSDCLYVSTCTSFNGSAVSKRLKHHTNCTPSLLAAAVSPGMLGYSYSQHRDKPRLQHENIP